jgi:predicted phosphodiesterase
MTQCHRLVVGAAACAVLCLVIAAPAAAQSQPYKVFDTRPVITQGPYLMASSATTATIVWFTDAPSHSRVRYGTGTPLSEMVEPQIDGLVPVGLRHVVTLTGLTPGTTYSYQAISTRVVRLNAYWPDKGLDSESPVHQFTTLDPSKPAASFSVVTDTHEDVARINRLMKMIDWTTTDFLVHTGDAFDWIDDEDQLFRRWLTPIITALRSRTPFIYARGNHELRGPFARQLADYVPTPEGRFYYARDAGPVHLLVIDTGEDKPDDTNVYARLNRTIPYRAAELAWLREHVKTSPRVASAPFRVAVMHQPTWGWLENGNAEWIATANDAGLDLLIAGHRHRFSYTPPGPDVAHKYHLLVVGQDQVARVDATATELTATVTAADGKVVETIKIPVRKQ